MATTLGKIAEVSEAEAILAEDFPRTEEKEGDKTLWEGEEVALRYVLEDGKLNVCLRNLVEWRRFCRERRNADLADESPSVRESLDAFEKGMGTVLRNAWNHIEALQTTDIPLLVQYMTGVMKDAAEEPERVAEMSRSGDLAGRQEVMCLSYLRGLVSRLGDHEEERVMPILRSAGTAVALAAMLHANHRHLGGEGITVGAEALARVCDTEDFRTYRDEYIGVADKETFARLKTDFVANLCGDPDRRRTLRPLLDTISYCERTRPRK